MVVFYKTMEKGWVGNTKLERRKSITNFVAFRVLNWETQYPGIVLSSAKGAQFWR